MKPLAKLLSGIFRVQFFEFCANCLKGELNKYGVVFGKHFLEGVELNLKFTRGLLRLGPDCSLGDTFFLFFNFSLFQTFDKFNFFILEQSKLDKKNQVKYHFFPRKTIQKALPFAKLSSNCNSVK